MPCELLVQKLCDLKQGYTQYGGLRPYGVSLLYAGHDHVHGFQLYQSDPSGNYSGWLATCIGQNSSNVTSILKQDYVEGMTLENGVRFAVKVLSKTLESTTLTADKLEISVISFVDGEIAVTGYSEAQIDVALKLEQEAAALLAAEKAAAEKLAVEKLAADQSAN